MAKNKKIRIEHIYPKPALRQDHRIEYIAYVLNTSADEICRAIEKLGYNREDILYRLNHIGMY